MVEFLARGIEAEGRGASYKRRKAFSVKKKNKGKFPEHPKVEKPETKVEAPKYYPADDVKKPLTRRFVQRKAKLRGDIKPGSVLIVLAGRFRGKRVIFLKQLDSGFLLVTGPFKVNGVPLRRIAQTFTICTSTVIDLPKSLDVSGITDEFFTKGKKSKKQAKTEQEFFNDSVKAKELPKEWIDANKKVDAALDSALSEEYKAYLSSRFTLRDGDRPHLMKF